MRVTGSNRLGAGMAVILCFSSVQRGFAAPQGDVGDPDAPFVSGAKYIPGANSARRQSEIYSDPQYTDCGQSCFYSKSNENITLQIDHISEKLQFLQTDVKPDPAANDQMRTQQKVIQERKNQEKFEVLGSFCRPDEKQGNDPEACIQRYAKTMDFFLVKMRTALAKNENSEYLMHGDPTSGIQPGGAVARGTTDGSRSSIGPVQPKKTQRTYLTQSKNLANFIPPEDVQRMLNVDIDSLKPNPEDFVKFKKIQRDPGDPLSGFFVVPADRVNGQVDYDRAAYQAALAAWEGSKSAAPGVRAELAARVADPQFGTDRQMERKKFTEDFSRAVDPATRSKARELYDNARKGYIDDINTPVASVRERLTSGAQKSLTFGPQPAEREPSTGNETVQDIPNASGGTVNRSARYTADQVIWFENDQLLTTEQKKERDRLLQKQ